MNVETMEDFAATLAALGWTIGRDEVGDHFAQMRVGDIILTALLGCRDSRHANIPRGTLDLSMGRWATTDAVSAAYTLILHPKKRYSDECIVFQNESLIVQKPIVDGSDVADMSDQIIIWGKSCDIEAGLKALREVPTNSIGAMPARHLAALAEAGDVETLTRYRDSFAAGDRLGFVPYIDEGFIARALKFAECRQADPNWLPDKPRMRI